MTASETTEGTLVGREDALAELSSALQQASAGRPRLLVVRGEAGIGKSHLLRVLCARARAGGFWTLIGHGHEGMDLAYLALRDALAPRAEDPQPEAPALRTARALLSGASGPSTEPAEMHAIELCEALVALARQRPLLLALEDMHWLDRSSLRLLLQLAFTLGDGGGAALDRPRLLVVATTRAALQGSESARVLERMLREPSTGAVELSGLDLLDTVALVRAQGFARPTQAAAQALHVATLGNPLFVKSLLQLAWKRGTKELSERVDPRTDPLGTDLLSVVSSWLDGAPAEALPLLRRAALLGPRFSLSLLAAVLRRDVEQVGDVLAKLPELVVVHGDHAAFAHPLVRHALLERLPEARRAELHAEIAGTLARSASDAGGDRELMLAHHLLCAGDAAPAAERRAALGVAVQRLTALGAFGEAAVMHLARSELCTTPRERADAQYAAGECQQRNFDAAACVQSFALAERLYREQGDPERAARALSERSRIELYSVPLGQQRDVSALERELITLPPQADSARGWILQALADAAFYARKPEVAIEHAELALEHADRASEPRLSAYASVTLALSRTQSMHYELAARAYEAALTYVAKTAEPRLAVVPRVRRAAVLHTQGALERARTEHLSAIELATRMAEHGEHAFALSHLIGLCATAGEFEAAEMHAHAMARMLGRVDARPWAALVGVPGLAFARHATGRSADALAALNALREPGRFVDKVGGAEHVACATLSDLIALDADELLPDEDRAERRARVARYAERVSLRTADGSGLSVVCALLELCSALGLHQAARGPKAVLEHALRSGAVFTPGWPFSIPRVLGNSALAHGEPEVARSLLEAAAARCEDAGAQAELARCRLDLVRALLTTHGAAAERAARSQLAEVLDACSALGMTTLLRKAGALCGALGMPEVVVDRPLRVAASELQLLSQLGAGESPARVAERHLLSAQGLRERTASLLSRMGAAGPLDAAAYGLDLGLFDEPSELRGTTLCLLVTDLVGFTPLVERLGDAHAQSVMHEHNRVLRAALADHGGLEITHTGDGVIAAFRSAPEAAGCALALQRAMRARAATPGAVPLTVRIGLHMGDALPEEGRLFGAAVITAVRICGLCEGDHILVSEVAERACHGLKSRFVSRGTHALKGFSNALQLFELTTEDTVADTAAQTSRITP